MQPVVTRVQLEQVTLPTADAFISTMAQVMPFTSRPSHCSAPCATLSLLQPLGNAPPVPVGGGLLLSDPQAPSEEAASNDNAETKIGNLKLIRSFRRSRW